MTSKSEKGRRKTIVREAAQHKKVAVIAAMPISQVDLSDLFSHLDGVLAAGCDHSLKFTREFLKSRGLPEAAIIPWLGEYGGYCDCEVLANVEQELEQ